VDSRGLLRGKTRLLSDKVIEIFVCLKARLPEKSGGRVTNDVEKAVGAKLQADRGNGARPASYRLLTNCL
jgi:hypothetical protein